MAIVNSYYWTTQNTPQLVHNLGFTPTNGNTLVAFYAGSSSGMGIDDGTSTTLTQTGANWTLKLDKSYLVVEAQVWIAENINGANSTLNIGSGLGGNEYLYVLELSGVPASSFDVVAGNNYAASTANPRSSGAITTSVDGCLALSAIIDGYNNLHTVTGHSSGYTEIWQATQGTSFVGLSVGSVFSLAQKTISSAGSDTASFTLDAATTSYSSIVSIAIKQTAPTAASNPSPTDTETDVSLTPTFSWTGNGGPTGYNVYLGTSPGSLTLVSSNQAGTTYTPSARSYDTTYYWRVDSLWAGSPVTGTVWSFSTIVDPNSLTAEVSTRVDTLLHVMYTASVRRDVDVSVDIAGFRWDEMRWPSKTELEGYEYADSAWDPNTYFLPASYFKSGIGDNKDLLVLEINDQQVEGKRYLLPKVQHGYFYFNDEQRYLYSDDVLTQYTYANQLYSGVQYVDLEQTPKTGIPVSILRYQFDRNDGRYSIDLDFRKVLDFTGEFQDGDYLPTLDGNGDIISGNLDASVDEFKIDYDFSPPRIWLNGNYAEVVGNEVTYLASGITDASDVASLELLGIADGVQSVFLTEYSPIDQSGILEVWTYLSPDTASQWTEIGALDDFSAGYLKEFQVDYDLGRIIFDDQGNGQLPGGGVKVACRYTKGLAVRYEPEGSRDTTSLITSDMNPLNTGISRGVIQVTTGARNAATILLETDMDISENDATKYSVDISNTIQKVYATVRDINGVGIDGLIVNFVINDPAFGTFTNGGTEAAALTDQDGIATIFYIPPTSTIGFGHTTDDVTHSGSTTRMVFENAIEPYTLSGVYLYEVQQTDVVLGINQADLSSQYTTYFSDEGITQLTNSQSYEEAHRLANSMLTSATYAGTSEDLDVGAKRIVLRTGDSNSVDPHLGTTDSSIYIPLFPTSYEFEEIDTIPTLTLVYSGLLTLPGSNGIKAYQIIENTETSLSSSVLNSNTGRTIRSNNLNVEIEIPDDKTGLFIANELSDIEATLLSRVKDIDDLSANEVNAFYNELGTTYSGEMKYDPDTDTFEDFETWFRATRRGDTQRLTLNTVAFSGSLPAKIPLGFRLKGRGSTLASLLDQVVFFDPNGTLAETYFSGII